MSTFLKYRRGIPARPKKYWGKKVRFTPKNIILNWIFNHLGFIESPVNKGYHWINPAIIANTAPIERYDTNHHFKWNSNELVRSHRTPEGNIITVFNSKICKGLNRIIPIENW